jgi:disulfide bond formation protein DsbB
VTAGDAKRELATVAFEMAIDPARRAGAPAAHLVIQNSPLGGSQDKKTLPQIAARQAAQLHAAKVAGLTGELAEVVGSVELPTLAWTTAASAVLSRLLVVLWIKANAARKPAVVAKPLF